MTDKVDYGVSNLWGQNKLDFISNMNTYACLLNWYGTGATKIGPNFRKLYKDVWIQN